MRRRKAREYALQLLFQLDFTGKSYTPQARDDFWSEKKDSGEVREFAEGLVRGTVEHIGEIDNVIERVTENWALRRMAAVDRNILRFAAYEIFFRKDIPSAVTINEALEIAKKYSSSESASFLNGVLDKLAQEAGKA